MAEKSKTVTNALRVLNCFQRANTQLSVSEIARELKLPRPNVLRVLASLEELGFITRHGERGAYSIGVRLFELGMVYLRSNPFSRLFTDALDELSDKTQCPSYVGILDGPDVVFLNSREGTLPVQFIWKAGDRLPSTTTALGKAILMHLSKDEVDRHLGKGDKLVRITPNSIATRKQLEADLAQARDRGWALAREESHAGLTGVGAPMFDGRSQAVAALSISYLDYSADPKRMEMLAAVVMDVAAETSKRLQDSAIFGASPLVSTIKPPPKGLPAKKKPKDPK